MFLVRLLLSDAVTEYMHFMTGHVTEYMYFVTELVTEYRLSVTFPGQSKEKVLFMHLVLVIA